MKRFLIFVFVLAVAVGALGYSRGWFRVTTEGKPEVQVDGNKYKQDKEAFGKTVGEKAKAMKERVAGLWKKSETLAGDDKVQMQTELADLKARHDRLEQQLKDLEDSGEDRFESIKQDLSKSLDDVEKRIEVLSKKLEKATDK